MPIPLRRVALPVLFASALLTPLALVAPATAAPVQTIAAAAAAVGQVGTFITVDPVRLVDTRSGLGGGTGKLGQGGEMVFHPAANNAIPATGVSAVLLNVTGTEPTNSTFLTLWPTAAARPGTSSLNLLAGQTRPNQVVVPFGPDGKVQLRNNAGSTHAIVDLQGFYSTSTGATGGKYHPIAPERVLDTRVFDEPFAEGEASPVYVDATGVGAAVAAVEINITITEPTASGHLSAWDGATPTPPTVSNANFVPGQTVANHTVVGVTLDPAGFPYIGMFNSRGITDVIVDVLGWYDNGTSPDGLRFEPTLPSRVLDTRGSGSRVAAGGTVRVPTSGLPAPSGTPAAQAHVVNLTATDSVGAGFALAWSGDGAKPFVSNVNFVRGEDSPNLATAAANSAGGFAVSAGASAVHLIADYQGYFY